MHVFVEQGANADPGRSSVAQASAQTLPTSVTETMTARTTLTRPTVVCSHTHTHTHTYTHVLAYTPHDFLYGVFKTHVVLSSYAFLSMFLSFLSHQHTHTHSLSPTAMCMCTADIHVCLPSQFKCTHPSRCIPGIFRCNGQDNCGEGEDEKDCRECAAPLTSLVALLAPSGWWLTSSTRPVVLSLAVFEVCSLPVFPSQPR